MSKVNLLELCLSPSLGGLELYMMHAAKALNDDYNLLSVIASGSQLEPYFKDIQYKCISIKHSSSRIFFSAKKLAKIIDENSIDIVHIHWTKDLPTVAIAKFFAKKKFKLVQSRHMNMTRFKNDFYHRYLYKQVDLILAVTAQVANQVKRYIPESVRPRVEVLYIGSEQIHVLDKQDIQDYRKKIGIEDEFTVGMVGRIEEAKGQYLLIEALDRLKAKGVSVKAFFVGHAMQEAYLQRLKTVVENKGLEKEITFLGFTKQPLRFMQACDVMVLATRCETFGLVLIEAMQVGTPVVATNQCGPLEIIEDGKSGLLFEVDNSEDLSNKLLELSKDVSRRDEIAKAAKIRAEEMFSSTGQFRKLSEIIKDL